MSPNEPPPGRRVTFRNPKAGMSPKKDVGDYSTEPSVSDVEMWLEWQAWQLGTPTWLAELKAILGIRDPQMLAQKIRASFYIPEIRMRTLQEPEYTVPPTPRSLDRKNLPPRWVILSRHAATTSSPDDFLCQEPAILGGTTKSAEKPESLPFSRKCRWTMGGSQRVCYLLPLRHCMRFRGNWLGIPKPRAPMPPFLATCCHHWRRNRNLREQLLMLHPPSLKEIWPSMSPHQPEQRGRTLVCYSSQPL